GLGDTEYHPHDLDSYCASPLDFAVDFLNPPTAQDSLGRLGEIDILQVIGHGGMGMVLKGFQPALNRPVAVKVLAPHLATSGAARQRFAREAQAAAVIMHANVMPIFSVDSQAKLPYLVMPFIECESLQQRIDRVGKLETIDVLRIGLQMARGLAAAHAQGLVHRDVKPANILLEQGVQRALLTDFGLARAVDDASLTRTGLIAGTPQYMSPEQARGDAIDSRSDLFSLGSVLYTACAGRPPFRAETSYGILRKITDTQPRSLLEVNPQVPIWLSILIERLMAKSPADRFQDAEQVAQLLEQSIAHLQQPQAWPLPVELQPRRAQPVSSDTIVALIAAALTIMIVFLVVGGVWIWRQRTTAQLMRARAAEERAIAVHEQRALEVLSAQALAAATAEPDAQIKDAVQPLTPLAQLDELDAELQRLQTDLDVLQRQHDLLMRDLVTPLPDELNE
ncbi:MAG: serine/threonine protein kinase, partial [Planctomycetales bacterium]|nr:serine/threonine protein kinase [Planctomycetales bacterium]